MNFYLSDRSPLHSTFSNEDGQAIYKVETPMKFTKRTTTITKVVPNIIPRKGEDTDLRDQYAHLAQIEFRSISTSIIRIGGEEIRTKSYFRKEGWGVYGRNRAFTGPDGREYKWLLKSFVPELVLNDGSNTPVARFYRKSLGIIGKARPARLEITPEGKHMADTILVTFVYIEKVRKDKERAATTPNGGGS